MSNNYRHVTSLPTNYKFPALMNMISRIVYWITTGAMMVSAACVLVSLVLITYSVFVRYVVGSPSLWVDSVVGFLLVAIVMFGTAATLREGRHLGVDILTGMLSKRANRWAQTWALLAVLVVACYLIVDGWQTAMFSRMLGMTTHGYVQIPIFWLQLLVPFGGALLVLVSLESLARITLGGPAYATSEEEEAAK